MAELEKTEGAKPEEQDETKPAETVGNVSPDEFAKVKKALADANKEAAARRKRLDELEKAEADRKTAEMTELEKANARLKELEAKQRELERRELQRKIAAEVGIPDILATRLVGDTQEAMTDDAKELLEALKLNSKKQAPTLPPNNPGDGKKGEGALERRARLLQLNNANVLFDVEEAKKRGGGVHFTND